MIGADSLPSGHLRVVSEAGAESPDWYVSASNGVFDSIELVSPSAEGHDLAKKIIDSIDVPVVSNTP